jgi:hypothetical protein
MHAFASQLQPHPSPEGSWCVACNYSDVIVANIFTKSKWDMGNPKSTVIGFIISGPLGTRNN